MRSKLFLTITICASLLFVSAVYSAGRPSRQPDVTAPWYASSDTATSESGDWAMAGANPQRTSWNSEEVQGRLQPIWYKQFEPYISQKVQIIAALDTLYVSTAAGLYALNAETGAERWVYPTALPLGHSPTIDTARGIAYVGGFDHKLHAINAYTGDGLWTFEATGGFHTNPLLAEGKVFAGNRDGNLYAVYAEGPYTGLLAWSFATDGPILYSAAYQDGVLYFASSDSYAYALDAGSGALIWKSNKLPGAGFHSWWPVIYEDRVIFAGSNNYRAIRPGAGTNFSALERDDVYPNAETDPQGTFIGPVGMETGSWVAGTTTIRADRVLSYFGDKPWRRTYLVLNRFTGEEVGYAPVLWTGNDSGNRYPPIVGADGVLYQQNNYMSDPYIPGGHVSGWKLDTPYISVVTDGWNAVDEPMAYSSGGNLIYWSNCCDRAMGSIDISVPLNSSLPREWTYYSYDLYIRLPGYNDRYYHPRDNYNLPGAVFGGADGIYGNHGDNNPPIPYRGRVYSHHSNAVIAFDASGATPVALPVAEVVPVAEPVLPITPASLTELGDRLAAEVHELVGAGHLRPVYASHGLFDWVAGSECGDGLIDYWHSTAETIYTLTAAWPYLPADLQQQVRAYLEQEITSYPPYRYNHVGWGGAAREAYDVPPDAQIASYLQPIEKNYSFQNLGGWNDEGVWGRNPFTFYALWKYAGLFGDASTLLAESQAAFWEEFEQLPRDEVLINMPSVHNAYIAGFFGLLGLQQLAGVPASTQVEAELERLLELRATTLTAMSPVTLDAPISHNCRTLNVSRNFIFMVPELAGNLREAVPSTLEAVVESYEYYAPYWFVTLAEESYGENSLATLYDSHALFIAKAWALDEYRQVLQQYLDVPAFPRGDLFYIQKLVATIAAEEAPDFILVIDPMQQLVPPGGSATYVVTIQSFGQFDNPVTLNVSASGGIEIDISQNPIIPPGRALLTLTDISGDLRTSRISVIATAGETSMSKDTIFVVGGHPGYLPFLSR